MTSTIIDKVRQAELQAEIYRLQKLLARRERQNAGMIQGRLPWTIPKPEGGVPNRDPGYATSSTSKAPAGAASEPYISALEKINTASIKPELLGGYLVEAISTNYDNWLRRNYNGHIGNIGVLTSGGDAPGMNAAIRAVVLTALNFGYGRNIQAYGIQDGYCGFYGWVKGKAKPKYAPFKRRDVWEISGCAGSILRSMRFSKWKDCMEEGWSWGNACDGLVVIGGDGSTRGAAALWKHKRMPVVVCPATIDNDTHPWSDRSIGFDSAVQMATTMLDALRATSSASGRVFLAQLMGRHRGDLPLFTGVAGHADLVMISERSGSGDLVWDYLRLARILKLIYQEIERSDYGSALVAVAEGVELSDEIETLIGHATIPADKKKELLLQRMVKALEELHDNGFDKHLSSPATQKLKEKWQSLKPYRDTRKLEFRTMDLGHAQRGGRPVPSDIILASRIGAHAVEVLCTMDWEWAERAHPDEVPFIGVINDRPTVTWVDPF